MTQSGHTLHPGYVARSVSSSAAQVVVTTEGEGQNPLQSWDFLGDPVAAELWGQQTQGIDS